VAKRDNVVVRAQRHVIAPFISFLLIYGVFIQGVSNKRDGRFSGKVHQNFAQIGNFCLTRVVKLLNQKQLNIDTNILHQVGIEFDVDSKNRSANSAK